MRAGPISAFNRAGTSVWSTETDPANYGDLHSGPQRATSVLLPRADRLRGTDRRAPLAGVVSSSTRSLRRPEILAGLYGFDWPLPLPSGPASAPCWIQEGKLGGVL